MNKTYRLVWRASANAFVAVAECCRAKGKGGARGSALVLAGVVSSLLSSGAALAAPGLTELPTGGKLVAGSASISGANGHLSIQQSTPRAAIDWQSFNVGSQAQVQFLQPSAASVTLNRVLGGQASEILGRIQANGQVFLVNPSGVYFGRGASVNVGALVATTHSISNTDFMAGKNTFARLGSTGSVVNEGQLRAALEAGLGGYIALMAPEVRNQGVIVAQLGTVALASGESITLDISGSHTLAGLTVSPSQIKSLVDNRHLVEAPGGLIILSAQAANALQGGVVKNSGDLEASGLVQDGGRIRLVASDQIDVGGSLRANAAPSSNGDGGSITAIADLKNPDSVTMVSAVISAKGGDLGGQGGFVETSASRLKIDSPTRVDTLGATGNVGMWLLDPVNITVQAVGGDVTGSTIATALQTTDVTLDSNIGSCTGVACGVLGGTAGDITVNDAIATTVDGLPTTLTLNAFKNIAINAAISNAGASALNVVLNSDSTRNGIGGVTLNGTGSIATNGGNVELYGNSIDLQAGSSINTTPVAPFPSGVIALIGNAMTIAGAVTGNADLNIMPLTANKTIGIAGGAGDIQLTATNFSTDFSNTFSGINIGDLTTGTITVGAAGVTIAAGAGVPVTFQTNAGMVLNGGLNAAGLQLNLFDGLASMSSFSGSGNISAATLFLAGSGTTQFLLNTAIGNNVTTLVGLNGSGNLSFYNSTALSVGNIFGLGVATDGLIDIQTLNGNLTVTQAITTTSAAANAITLNAGRAETALTAGASNIHITGAGTVTAAAGIAKLYSGSVAGSTGLTALVGSGSGRFRYSSDEVTSNFSAALSTGLNAIYRESSAITVQQMAVVSTYGTAFAPVGYEVAAGTLQNGDINVGTIGATLGSSGSAASPVGAYDLSITGLFPYSSLGYALTGATNTGGHTITQRPINLTANAGQTKIYGNTDPTLTYATEANGINSGIVGSDTFTGAPTRAAGENVGSTYAIGQGTLANSNYLINFVADNFAITQRPITVTADAKSKVYGDADPALTYAVTTGNLVTGDNLTGVLTRATGENVNTYTIDASALANSNYLITATNGTLTINPAPLTVTADDQTRLYGAANPSLTTSVTGFVNGETALTAAGYTGSGGASTTATPSTNVGAATITASAGTLAATNYDFSTLTNGTLTINKAPLTVTADDQTRLYGAANPSLTTTVTGFVNGETTATAAGYTGSGGASTTATPSTNVGAATISASAGTLAATNYDFSTLTNGTLTINKAPLTVTANDAGFAQTGVAYSGGNGVAYSGFVNGEASNVLGGALSYSGTSQGAINPGTYTITPGGLTSSNYALAFTNGTLTISATVAPTFTPLPISVSTPAPPSSISNSEIAGSSITQGQSVLPSDAAGSAPLTISDQPAASDSPGLTDAGVSTDTGTSASANPPATVTPDSLASMSTEQIREITPAQIASLDAPALQALQPSQLSALTKQQVQALSTQQVQQLNLSQIQAMVPQNFATLSLPQVTALLPAAKRDLLRLAAVARESGSSPRMDFRQANEFAQSLAPFMQQLQLSEEFGQRVAAMPWNPALAKLRNGEWPTFPGMQVGMVRVADSADNNDPLVRMAAEIGGYFSTKTAETLFRRVEQLIPVKRLLQGKAVRTLLDASPIVGNLLSLYTVTTGKDALTGETVDDVERALAMLGTVPGGGALLKVAGKSSFGLVQKLLLKANQGKLTQIKDVGELANQLVNAFQAEAATGNAPATPEITMVAQNLFKKLTLSP